MKFFSILLFSIIVFNGIASFAGFVLAGTVATGGNCTADADCINYPSSDICLCAPCGTCGPSMGNVVICSPTKWCSIDALAESVGNWLFYIALAIVPLMVVISGAMLLSSSGNPEKVNKAKDMLIWTMVGVGVMFISKILYVIIKSALGVT